MSTSALRRLAAGLVAAALVLGTAACGASDVSRSDFQAELEDGGLTDAQAACVTDRLFAQLDQGQVNELYEADDLGGEVGEAGTAALEECAGAE